MLPPGHIAAGYLTAEALLKLSHPNLTGAQTQQLLWWGMLFGFAPDFDFFYLFVKSKSLKADPRKGDHRYFFSHAPALWLFAGLMLFILSPVSYIKYFGLLLWLGSWSHFLLDSIQYGIMWLWPFNRKIYCLYPIIGGNEMADNLAKNLNKNFIGYWVSYLREYAAALKISLICEVLLVTLTLILRFNNII